MLVQLNVQQVANNPLSVVDRVCVLARWEFPDDDVNFSKKKGFFYVPITSFSTRTQ